MPASNSTYSSGKVNGLRVAALGTAVGVGAGLFGVMGPLAILVGLGAGSGLMLAAHLEKKKGKKCRGKKQAVDSGVSSDPVTKEE
mmetsp:Transcript_22184/g.29281  ORF Transcript_22184/g.29281 Transcript_22184/m.29281 type:complete len:85 (-) Transcript_22184:265-519(-)